MNRDERRSARLAVIAEERERKPYGYAKRAANKLGMTQEQVRRLASWWGIACPKK